MVDEGFLRDFPTAGLSIVVDDASFYYREAFEKVWGLESNGPPEGMEEDDWRSLLELYRISKKFSVGAATLIRPPKVRERDLTLPEWLEQEAQQHEEHMDGVLEILKEHYPDEDWEGALEPRQPSDPRMRRRFFEICLELEAYERFHVPVSQMAKRMLRLVRLMVREQSEFVRTYLSRVAECYIRGMSTELAVMARVVLELALTDAIGVREIADAVGEGKLSLERRIEAAYVKGLLAGPAYAAAGRLRKAGNASAHGRIEDWAGLPADYTSDSVLDDLAAVLRAVQDGRER